MDTVQSSSLAVVSAPVELNGEAPFSEGEPEQGVISAVAAISGKAALEGSLPGTENRASEISSARPKNSAGVGNADGSAGKEEVNPGTQALREEADHPAHSAEESADRRDTHVEGLLDSIGRRADGLESIADRHHGKSDALRDKAEDVRAGGNHVLACKLEAEARHLEGKADRLDARAEQACL